MKSCKIKDTTVEERKAIVKRGVALGGMDKEFNTSVFEEFIKGEKELIEIYEVVLKSK